MRRILVAIANSINIVFMAVDAEHGLSAFDIVHVDATIASTSNKLAAVSGETNRPNLDTVSLYKQG